MDEQGAASKVVTKCRASVPEPTGAEVVSGFSEFLFGPIPPPSGNRTEAGIRET